jgi:ATP-binding cassette subfamily F protein 3
MFEKQQRERAHLQKYVDRFRAKATKARQAQSRIKALERMETIAAAHIDTPFTFSFRECGQAPDPLLQIEDAAAGYADAPILSGMKLTIRPGERIGLLGRNGAGKSTLIKLLSGGLRPSAGVRREGKGLEMGYFAQHALESLRPDESPLQHMLRLDPQAREQELRNYLGGFDFHGDMATTPCGPFSGGEKSRLALALLIWHKPNLLLLDEPTNHLDLEMRHALTLALQDYEGGMVIVSHDRALLRATCDRFLLVDGGRLSPFDGDLDDYKAWLAQQRAADAAASQCPDRAADKASRKADRETAAADRQARLAARRPLLRELEQLEKKLKPWSTEKTQLDERLADPALSPGPEAGEVPRLLKRQAELSGRIDEAELRWLELHEALEAIPAD